MSELRTSRIVSIVGLLVAGGILLGNDRCQESVCLGCNATSLDSSDATATPTGTTTPAATTTGSATVTSTPTGTPTEEATATEEVELSFHLNSAARALADVSQIYAGSQAAATTESKYGSATGNWITGKGGSGSKFVDSDGDGFSDELEQQKGSDFSKAAEVPVVVFTTKLAKRVPDYLSNTDPKSRFYIVPGTHCSVGLAALGIPTTGPDTDKDCIPDSYETAHALLPKSSDSDGDGLRDDTEVMIGSNPLDPDTDGDGVSDGVEYQAGSDPALLDSF